MSKSLSRCWRIGLLTIGCFCKFWERNRSSEGRGTGWQCVLWYPCLTRVLDLGGVEQGGGEGRGGTGGLHGLVWLRPRKCCTLSAGTPTEASASSSPLPVSEEAVAWSVFHRIVARACIGREG